MAELGLVINTYLSTGFYGYQSFEQVLSNEFETRQFEFFDSLSALYLGYGGLDTPHLPSFASAPPTPLVIWSITKAPILFTAVRFRPLRHDPSSSRLLSEYWLE